MNLSVFIAALEAAVLARLSSFGTAFAAGLGAIGIGFLAHERTIGVNVMAKFHDTYTAKKAAGESEINAIEEAATAALNEFCADEAKEFTDEARAIITLLKSSAQSAANL